MPKTNKRNFSHICQNNNHNERMLSGAKTECRARKRADIKKYFLKQNLNFA